MPAKSLSPLVLFFVLVALFLWRVPSLNFFLTDSDHAHQMVLAQEITMDKFPFVDLFFHYGPLPYLTSALGLAVWDSILSEMIVCSIGYALALVLVFQIVRRVTSDSFGLLAVVWGVGVLGRFYKWYYWLFPVLFLFLAIQWLESDERRRHRVLFLAGIACGIGWLFRFDLGLVGLVFWTLFVCGATWFKKQHFCSYKEVLVLLGSFLIPLLIWFFVLASQGGIFADYLRATFSSSTDVVRSMSIPFPAFNMGRPFSRESVLFLMFLAVPTVYLAGLGYGLYRARCDASKDCWILFAGICLLGLGLFPQALHRPDLLHLRQVIPPFLMACVFILFQLTQKLSSSGQSSFAGLHRRIAIAGILLGLASHFFLYNDLAPMTSSPIQRYQELIHGVTAETNHPKAPLIREIINRTSPDDSILVTGTEIQLYLFTHRRMSGFNIYLGLPTLASPAWRQRNLEAIRKDPPSLVVAYAPEYKSEGNPMLKDIRPELYEYLNRNYTKPVFQTQSWVLLAPSS